MSSSAECPLNWLFAIKAINRGVLGWNSLLDFAEDLSLVFHPINEQTPGSITESVSVCAPTFSRTWDSLSQCHRLLCRNTSTPDQYQRLYLWDEWLLVGQLGCRTEHSSHPHYPNRLKLRNLLKVQVVGPHQQKSSSFETKVRCFRSSESFQPVVLYSTERQFFLNLGK
ncbi:MAG: hypothetical protein Q6L68_15005, partial [Thermostichus sp. DG02_5_bins_236]